MTDDILTTIGFTANEAVVYRALLTIGETTPSQLAKQAGLPRTYVYDLLRALEEKGFVSSIERGGKRHVSAIRPKQIKQIAAQKLAAFDSLLPELEGLYQGAPNKPSVRYFEGATGLSTIHHEILDEAKELRFYGVTSDWIAHFGDWYEFAKSFVDGGIRVFDLVTKTPETLEYSKLYAGTPSEMRFAKKEWDFQANVAIWGNKVAFLSYTDQMHGVVIESTAIAATQTATFEILWNLGEQYGNKPKVKDSKSG